jgi:cytochrome c peroxidase
MQWLAIPLTAAMVTIGVLPATSGMAAAGDIQSDARAEARAKGLDSLRSAILSDSGQPLLLGPGKVPLPANLKDFVKDRWSAAQLGKALFWDQAIGSDGQACASCHFHAGADSRIQNQLNPDLLRVQNSRKGDIKGFHFAESREDRVFQLVGGGLGPNYTLKAEDFPFVKDIGANDRNGRNVVSDGDTILPAPGNTNDVASSQGAFWTQFQSLEPNIFNPFALLSLPIKIRDKGTPQPDPKGFLVSAPFGGFGGKTNVRRVEPRNTPTMINAVFNLHNFWDGRANFFFNGVNPFGKTDTDPGVGIYVSDSGSSPQLQRVDLKFASLASQAVGPPLSIFEMSFDGRSFPELGTKMIGRKLLAQQIVHPQDSLLGELLATYGPAGLLRGINVTYEGLIKDAFQNNLWGAAGTISVDGQEFTQMEANFSFFFGVAVMLYEAELVADQSKFDRWMEEQVDLTGQEIAGLGIFMNQGRCVNCHGGPEFSNATIRNTQAGINLVEPMLMGDGNPGIYDNGFYNISVTPTPEDRGRGDRGPGDRPLASTRQFLFKDQGIDGPINFPIIGLPIRDLEPIPGTDPPILRTRDTHIDVCKDLNGDGACSVKDEILLLRGAVDGAFKTPQLRNVELTGPYFHNGGMLTLMQVVEFYDDGGNFCKLNLPDLDPDIRPIGLSEGERRALVAFLLTLTDERVKYKSAPFDHPELRIPNGHPGNHKKTLADILFRNKQAVDQVAVFKAVGKQGVSGRDALQPFHVKLGIDDHNFVGAGVANVPCRREQASP